jgi:hypothetical protein
MHKPHSEHLSSSISGALKGSFWLIAPAGQKLITGHAWFWGHLDASILIAFMQLLN